MWKNYSAAYIKQNRASGVSIMAAGLTASLFLSLLCCLSYNFWIYERERAALEGDRYQGILAFDKETGGNPSTLLILYMLILTMVSVSLILIIRNAFEVSMHARIHQFGILSSIGATPRQIRICLLQEAAVLSLPSMICGSLSGIFICSGIISAINAFAVDVPGRHTAVFSYRPSIFMMTMLVSGFTVLFSAWIPARRLSRMTPLEAIRNAGGLRLERWRHAGILSFLFGVEGEIAGNALRAQRKSLRISTISLLLSFVGFSFMLCLTTLSDISTRYTYFERYQDAWDIMITLKDTEIQDFRLTEELQNVSGLQDVVVYQKAEAVTFLPEEMQSDELLSLGGLTTVAGTAKTEGGFRVEAPVVVMDDAGFLNFCAEIGIAPRLDGAIIYNRIWDSVNSNFRYPVYIPFVRQESGTTMLYHDGENDLGAEIPVLSYTGTVPVLREEYKDYGLVHFIPLTVWKETAWQIGGAEPDSCIRILSAGEKNAADLKRLEADALELVSREYRTVSENRIQERISNDRMIYGMQVIFGGFCVLLALIGIANVFSNTLGFLRQRKREFTRYQSIGFTPRQMEKLFFIEALVIAGRPFLITVPLTLLFVQFCVKASYLEPMVFWREAPVLPILLFAAAVGASVALAYYIGGKRLLQCDFSEVLRNDTLL